MGRILAVYALRQKYTGLVNVEIGWCESGAARKEKNIKRKLRFQI
jgi:hypothetical protein